MPTLLVQQRAQHVFHPYENRYHFPSLPSPYLNSSRSVPKPCRTSQMKGNCSLTSGTNSHVQQPNVSPLTLLSTTPPMSHIQQGLNASLATHASSHAINSSSRLLAPSASPPKLSPARAPARHAPVEDIVSYLKSWQPPLEYYARRRHQKTSFSYPSRIPSLPALLEERVAHDGSLDTVKPESAMSISPRALQRKIFPNHLIYGLSLHHPNQKHEIEDESDEDLKSDQDDTDDEDEDMWSETDSEEAEPLSTSSISAPTYFLQPLLLTKPSGY
ncbi:hypothetical protein O181_008565 [Austropuccinia psidii MF-1]|uniref:Uncharacterized protein n=1 Tax=Austropuccinia psidii MF-1 TaxID=1389203 RepID=A0A9Q3GJ07_9BASI|nr:hypothetical protein [Austropuccinia psidii MF-1]